MWYVYVHVCDVCVCVYKSMYFLIYKEIERISIYRCNEECDNIESIFSHFSLHLQIDIDVAGGNQKSLGCYSYHEKMWI